MIKLDCTVETGLARIRQDTATSGASHRSQSCGGPSNRSMMTRREESGVSVVAIGRNRGSKQWMPPKGGARGVSNRSVGKLYRRRLSLLKHPSVHFMQVTLQLHGCCLKSQRATTRRLSQTVDDRKLASGQRRGIRCTLNDPGGLGDEVASALSSPYSCVRALMTEPVRCLLPAS